MELNKLLLANIKWM